jgi:hypothetical protein
MPNRLLLYYNTIVRTELLAPHLICWHYVGRYLIFRLCTVALGQKH